MVQLRLFNSLSKKIEDFIPLNPPKVGMYTCGPTVYDFVHIGNFRTYTTADFLLRTLKYLGFEVTYIMNITDVGHLTGDNSGDADTGEDRMEKAAKREGKSAWDIARMYEEAFKKDYAKLHLCPPQHWTRATEHIEEQIQLVQQLETKGFTYRTDDGIYFDTAKFPEYGKLSYLDLKGIREGARVAVNEQKRNASDFALWKFSYPQGRSFDSVKDAETAKRQMEWESPWGLGFPGWHIECSAMSMKYLGETFDIHAGGEDLAATHHPNEIAQSEAATGKLFVKYWVHGAFMMVDGERMSKSKGNNYQLKHLEERGFDAMDLRYLYLQTHFRQKMNFTWEGLQAAHNALQNLKNQLRFMRQKKADERTILSEEKMEKVQQYQQDFLSALGDDLNMPKALSVTWEVMKSNIPAEDKHDLVIGFDDVFGLGLKDMTMAEQTVKVPEAVRQLVQQREQMRQEKRWQDADAIRTQIEHLGYTIEDTSTKTQVKKI